MSTLYREIILTKDILHIFPHDIINKLKMGIICILFFNNNINVLILLGRHGLIYIYKKKC